MSEITELDDDSAKSFETSAKGLAKAPTSELATRTHYAFVAYFDGSDPTGAIRSQTKSFLGAVLAALRGESAESAAAYATEEKSELRAEVESAFKARFPEDTAVPDIDGRSSVGPILPAVLAYLRTVEGVEAADGDGFEDTSLADDGE